MTKKRGKPPAAAIDIPIRLLIGATILNGMISSTPVIDRTKVDKRLWSRIALNWADALLNAAEEPWGRGRSPARGKR